MAYADESSDYGQNMKLAGFKDDSCEEIVFEDESGQISEQEAKLLHFDAYRHFSFISFTTDETQEFINYDSYNYHFSNLGRRFNLNSRTTFQEDAYFFILDNHTGKIYDMREISKLIGDIIDDDHFDIVFCNFFESDCCPADLDYLLLRVYEDYTTQGRVFQIKFKEDNIEIVQRMNTTQTTNFGVFGLLMSDRYGNIIKFYSSSTTCSYQKTDGTFCQAQYEGAKYSFGINSIMYMNYNNENYYLNSNGDFEKIELEENKIATLGDLYPGTSNYLYTKNNEYYYTTQKWENDMSVVKLVKCTLDSQYDWKYTIEEKQIYTTDSYSTIPTAGQGNFVYLLENDVFSVYDTQKQELTTITENYEFKNLSYNKSYNQVNFIAMDKTTLLEVKGYFTQDNNIVIGSFDGLIDGLNRVYIVNPLN